MKKILTKGIVALFALVFVMTFAFAIGQLTFGNSTEGTAYADGTTVDLSTLTSGYTAQDGDTLTGTLGGNYQISIADGAHVTLNGVTINGVNSNEYAWAGLNLAGSATLILSGDNTVVGFHENYPGIFVPENKTLTISGEGTLIARSNGYGAGIGGGAFSDLAGGNIVIENGTITAYGGANGGAGIGSGYCGTCGDITITGGIITAEGGSGAAGIGGGAQEASCGTITIESTVAALSATLGGNSPTSIGQGVNGTCGTVTIRGEEGAITDRTYAFVTATADDVIALINEIGEVEYTEESKEKIVKARRYYDLLSTEEQAKVGDSLATLEAAENTYIELHDTATATETTETITNLPSIENITLDDKDAVVAARAAYDALSDEAKKQVSEETLAKLVAAEKEIDDIEKANDVADTIDALPAETVAKLEAAIQEIADIETAYAAEKSIDVVSDTDELTLADESAVQAARAAYEALTPNQKSKLPSDTLAALQEAEAVIAEIKTINVTDGEVKSYSKEIETGSADGTDVSVLFNQAAKDGSTSKEVQIKSGDTTVVFDANAVKQIGGNDVTFSATIIDNPDVEGAVFGIDLTLKGSTFQFGKATVSTAFNKDVPFGKKAVVYYVAYNGELVKMNTWLENGVLSFETNHFSPYVVKYELTGGSIAGIVIGCVIGLALIILLIILLVKLLKKRNKKDEEPKNDEPKKDDNDEVSEDAKDYVCIADEDGATDEEPAGEEGGATASEDSADEPVEESEEETEDEVPAEEEKTPAEEEAQAEEAEQGDEVPATDSEDSADEPEQAEEAEQEDEGSATAGEDIADEPVQTEEAEQGDEVPAEEPVEEPIAEDTPEEEEEVKEEPVTLKQSMAVAKTATHNTTWDKASIAKYLADKHGEEVEINERENFTSTGLPLADTHYAKDEDTRKCFVYVYETEGAPMLLINTDKELAKELAKRHSNVHKSAFPKSKDNWYSLPLDDSYSDEDVEYILDRCHANALGRDWDEQELSLKESLALAKSAKAEKTTHTTSKNSICEYLASKYGDEVALNTRDNYTRTGLPLADTHYVHGEDGKDRCFVYVYETQGSMMLLVRANYNFAKALKKNHPNVHKSAFPKSKEPWNSIILDDSFSDEEVHKLLDDVIALNK